MQSVNRRRFVKAAGSASIVSIMAGCTGGDGNSSSDKTTSESTSTQNEGGGSSEDKTRKIGISQHQAGGSWITAFFESGKKYANSQGYDLETFIHDEDAATQISQVRQMINQDYDGIVLVPWNKSLNPVIKEANDAGVPVFTANQDASTPAVKSFTAFGNRNAGKLNGERMYKELTEQKPDVDTYRVLNVRGAFIPQSNARTKGFLNVMDSHDDVKVVDTIQTDWTQSDAQSKVISWLNANKAPHGIYSSNMTSGIGTYQAVKDQGLAHPKGKDDHIVLTQLDGGPQVNPLILDGYVDFAVDQPVTYYIPLAIKQMEKYWEQGNEALPNPGTKLTADDFKFEPTDYKGGTLWSKPTWAPANVIESNGHPYVKTNGIILTKENADAPYLWGNIWG